MPFIGNGTKVKIPSEIKPPLVDYKFLTVSPTPGGMKFLLSRYFLTFLQFHQEQELMNKEIRKLESSQNVLELQPGRFFFSRMKDLPSL